jgi:hypothetical protein
MSLSNLTQTTPDEIRVTITLDAFAPGGKTLSRTPEVPMYFRHDQGAAQDLNRRHGIHWVVENLDAGETLEIQLDTSFPGYVTRPAPFKHRSWFEHLKMMFPTLDVLPSGALGWLLTPEKLEDHTGSAKVIESFELRNRLPENLPVIRYSIVLFDANGQEHTLDPGVEVHPDP